MSLADQKLKQATLDALALAVSQYKAAKGALAEERKSLVNAMRQARAAGATQREIGRVAGMTRQRIAQFLSER